MAVVKKKKKLPSKLPNFRRSLFWDVHPRDIDPKKHARYIIERILDFGREREVKWLFRRYSPRLIKKVLRLPRVQLHAKSKSLWSLVFR